MDTYRVGSGLVDSYTHPIPTNQANYTTVTVKMRKRREMKEGVETIGVFGAPNRVNHMLVYDGELLVYGVDNMLVWYDKESLYRDHKVAHEGKITHLESKGGIVVSCAMDKRLKVWKDREVVYESEVHENGLMGSSVVEIRGTQADMLIHYYDMKGNSFFITLLEGVITSLDLSFLALPILSSHLFYYGDVLFLGVSLSNQLIDIYLLALPEGVYHYACSLRGHSNWVQSIDSYYDDQRDCICLATASQDHLIRIWRMDMIEEIADELFAERAEFTYQDRIYSCSTEAILVGHDDWVMEIHFQTLPGGPQLLSCSRDHALIVWEQEVDGWAPSTRLGDMGGNLLGFEGCAWLPEGCGVVGYTDSGALHMWVRDEDWKPNVVPSGHSLAVQDIAWHPRGHFLVSASLDKTVRVYSACIHPTKGYFEIARPLIHGHPCVSVSVHEEGEKDMLYVGSEEKVIRVYESPKHFKASWYRLQGKEAPQEIEQWDIIGANRAPLGLSNKPFYVDQAVEVVERKGDFSEDPIPAVPETISQIPYEAHLYQSTLWPEMKKHYYHEHPVYMVRGVGEGRVVSSCKASQAKDAGIAVWKYGEEEAVQILAGHQLTVTDIAVHVSGGSMVSVSRDRSMVYYERVGEGYQVKEVKKRVHDRIIWGVAYHGRREEWITVSRDRKIKVWQGCPMQCIQTISLDGPITACAYHPQGKDAFVVGLESGKCIWYESQGEPYMQIYEIRLHGRAISKIAYHPTQPDLIATCSTDHTVQLHRLHF